MKAEDYVNQRLQKLAEFDYWDKVNPFSSFGSNQSASMPFESNSALMRMRNSGKKSQKGFVDTVKEMSSNLNPFSSSQDQDQDQDQEQDQDEKDVPTGINKNVDEKTQKNLNEMMNRY